MSETIEWIDADGASLTIHGGSQTLYQVDWGVTGRFMPTVTVDATEFPGQPGGLLRSVRHGIHEFVLPLSIAATSETNLRTILRALVPRMDPTRGMGKIRVTSPLADQREITCVYAAGLEMNEQLGETSGVSFQACPIAMVAYDPYWYAVSPVSETFTLGQPTVFFPVFPAYFSPSAIVVSDTVTNDGDLDTWPVWTITGPGAEIRLTNATTGEFIYLQGNTLGTGEVLTIDTRLGKKTLTKQDGSNVFDWLSLDSSLWSIGPGATQVSLAMTSTTASSGLTVTYYPRYLSP